MGGEEDEAATRDRAAKKGSMDGKLRNYGTLFVVVLKLNKNLILSFWNKKLHIFC